MWRQSLRVASRHSRPRPRRCSQSPASPIDEKDFASNVQNTKTRGTRRDPRRDSQRYQRPRVSPCPDEFGRGDPYSHRPGERQFHVRHPRHYSFGVSFILVRLKRVLACGYTTLNWTRSLPCPLNPLNGIM